MTILLPIPSFARLDELKPLGVTANCNSSINVPLSLYQQNFGYTPTNIASGLVGLYKAFRSLQK